ncbi:ATP-binding cassette domain-containing protein [Veronia nyctiphanis]|uniref:hypothetical protein n=1 Tax=Veronia nyctiphanis TaxID=1278244 RepID=UPI001376296B|nr:hypothetical protein [Veronia nyctiphanis]
MRKTDRVICLNGHICCQGKPEAVSATPEYHALFGFENESETALYLHKEQQPADNVFEFGRKDVPHV